MATNTSYIFPSAYTTSPAKKTPAKKAVKKTNKPEVKPEVPQDTVLKVGTREYQYRFRNRTSKTCSWYRLLGTGNGSVQLPPVQDLLTELYFARNGYVDSNMNDTVMLINSRMEEVQ